MMFLPCWQLFVFSQLSRSVTTNTKKALLFLFKLEFNHFCYLVMISAICLVLPDHFIKCFFVGLLFYFITSCTIYLTITNLGIF